MAYSLDTNTIVFCLRGKSAKVVNRLRTTPSSDLRVPMQVFAELLVGAAKSAKPEANEAAVRAFVSPYLLLWPNDRVISEADLWIAATARAHGDVVVTNNTNEFKRVPGLVVEDWSV